MITQWQSTIGVRRNTCHICTCFGSTYTKIGTIQRRLAWPLRKDDTQNREAFHIFYPPDNFNETVGTHDLIQLAPRRRWCSGIMQDSHSCEPGSIPGRRKANRHAVSKIFLISLPLSSYISITTEGLHSNMHCQQTQLWSAFLLKTGM